MENTFPRWAMFKFKFVFGILHLRGGGKWNQNQNKRQFSSFVSPASPVMDAEGCTCKIAESNQLKCWVPLADWRETAALTLILLWDSYYRMHLLQDKKSWLVVADKSHCISMNPGFQLFQLHNYENVSQCIQILAASRHSLTTITKVCNSVMVTN